MSTDEAIYRLLSIPLKESNRKVIFLPTELPEQRTRLLKSKKELESLLDNSVDIFQQVLLIDMQLDLKPSNTCVMLILHLSM